MSSYQYSRWDGSQQFQPQSADKLFDQLADYLMHYGDEALEALRRLPAEQADVLEQLLQRGYVEQDMQGRFRITPKGLRRVEHKALEALFAVRQRDAVGRHETDFRGQGQPRLDESRPYQYGDPVSQLNGHETLKNAIARQGPQTPIAIGPEDYMVYDTEYQTTCATVVLLDMSGSMSRYGKFGAAKKVAMALSALIRSQYQGDFLQTIGFYTYASPLNERELLGSAPKPVSLFDPQVRLRISLDKPPRFVPEHFTNIHAGLQFARRLLRRQPAQNRQILLITDGEPTAHVSGRDLLLIYPPSEQTALATLAEAQRCAREGIHLASFALIEDDFYLELVNFVERLAQVTGGVAAYCRPHNLGHVVLESFVKGRRVRRVV